MEGRLDQMAETASSDSPLFSKIPVAPKPGKPPVIVVGLPRSGSSFLSHVLSTLDDWYVFDDLHIYREAQAVKANGPLTKEQFAKLVHFLGWNVRARIRFEKHFFKPNCTWEDVDRMCDAVTETYRERPVTWPELLEEWLTRLAVHHGRTRWGYKTPQDFMHIESLHKLFPGVRFVFVIRDPRNMMVSLKYVHEQDGTPAQYQPYVYASYWKMAFETYRRISSETEIPIHLVRFENLIAEPDAVARDIAEFLGASISQKVPVRGSNTSFKGGKRKDLTSTEKWLCERIAGGAIQAAEYPLENARPHLRDIPDLVFVTCRFLLYQVRRVVAKPAERVSVVAFLRRFFKRS